MDAGGGGGGSVAAANDPRGLVRAVLRISSSPLFFWLLTVALVAAIHVASGLVSSRNEEKEREKRKPRRGGFTAAGEERNDDRVLEMMRSFSFVQATEDDFLEGVAAFDHVATGEETEPDAPSPASTFSFKFQHQMQEVPREAAVVSRELPLREAEGQEQEEENVPSVPLEPEDGDEARETELLAEERVPEQRRQVVVEATPSPVVADAHNYRFLTERDFRGFIREPEAMTVRVEESFVPPRPPPATVQPEERRVVEVEVAPRGGGVLTETDYLRTANEPDVCESVASSRSRKSASFPSYVCESVASSGKRTPSRTRKPARSPPVASRRSAVGGRMSFASESSGFGDSDSESSASDGYSVKELVVDSDSDWFRSEKDFPGAARDAGTRRNYEAKVLKAIEALEETAKLEQACEDSATTLSPSSVRHGSPDSISDGSVKYPEDTWSRSPSPDIEYKHDAENVATQAEEAEERNMKEEEESVDTSDDETSSGKKVTVPPGCDATSVADISFDHSEKGTITVNGHSGEAISDVQRSPEAVSNRSFTVASNQDDGPNARRSTEPGESVSDVQRNPEAVYERGFDVSSNQVGGPEGRRSPDPSEHEFVGDKRILETPEREFSANEHPFGMVPDAKYNLEYREEAEQASANDHSDNFAREAYISASGKAKMYDDDLEDPEVKWKDLTEEEEDELESLWEHQELIEQLKLELKKVRSIGLPTILEESETPKAPREDLKPWRMDAKFIREDPMDELNKFYKSYMERMRRFDILCYQKMYAIDFLQLRGSKQSNNSMNSLWPTVASILSNNFRPSRRRSPEDPSEQFLKELRFDLETVYVGQMCLSWEFLRWQYEQAYDLPESDPYHSHRYNQVAGEFQQFQVVVQRFVEDESFKGPRLPNYINNRCVLRNLLQVPVIKEDSLKDRMEDQRKGNYVITSEELEEIMEGAMHVLWEFIKADKVETTSVLKGLSNTQVELQDPSDHDLMMHIHAALQKKEKRLKDLLRTGNCIVKKFKKPKEDRTNQNLFFSQVDMRLMARVLRMPRITSDQLQWCKAKLDKIILVDRVKIHREPLFLLFPC